MKLSDFVSQKNLKDSDLDKFLEADQNVLLVSERGSGKTQRIKECMERNGLNYVYFSGSTMDPWIDFIGIPTEPENGECIKFLRPARMNSDLEAIIIDEFNRSTPEVMSACMELLQFRSINGVKFPKLRVIWAAVNPDDEDTEGEDVSEGDYAVQKMDPAQLDRFDVVINLSGEPCKKWFRKQYGQQGEIIVDWWQSQPYRFKKITSARRLEKALIAYSKNIAFRYVLPRSGNLTLLATKMMADEETLAFMDLEANVTEANYKKFLAVAGKDKIISVLKDNKYIRFVSLAPKEIFSELYLSDKNFFQSINFYIDQQINQSNKTQLFKSLVTATKEILEAHPNNSWVKEFNENQEMFESLDCQTKDSIDVSGAYHFISSSSSSEYLKLTLNRDNFLQWAKLNITKNFKRLHLDETHYEKMKKRGMTGRKFYSNFQRMIEAIGSHYQKGSFSGNYSKVGLRKGGLRKLDKHMDSMFKTESFKELVENVLY